MPPQRSWLRKYRLPGILGFCKSSPAEREALLAAIPQNGRMLEIGTHSGATSTWLATQRPDAFILGVDIFVATDCKVGEFAILNSRSVPNYRIFVGTVNDFAALGANSFDVVFVDADHRYPGCLNDLQIGEGLLAKGGRFLVHDYVNFMPGVIRATDEFAAARGYKVQRLADRLVELVK